MITAQEMDKRVPQGFLGMRGKKYDEDGIGQFYKRKPQFFVGVKGKKSLQELLDSREEFYKRALRLSGALDAKDASTSDADSYEYVPKRDGSLIGQIDYSTSGDGYQDRFPILNDILMQYMQKIGNPSVQNEAVESDVPFMPLTNEIAKRATDIHRFFGVRGKKSMTDKRPYDLSFRGKFIGVRGKKDVKNSGTHEIKFLLDGPLPKRKSQMGFFGMRGKKWAGGMFLLQ